MSFILLGILNAQAEAAAAGSYDLLETQVLSSSASSVTFTGLGSYTDYKHLQIRMTSASDRGTLIDGLRLRFNSDTGANYAYHRLVGNGGSVSSGAFTSKNEIDVANPSTVSNIFAGTVLDILDFADTSKNTTVRSLTGTHQSGFTEVRLISGLYNDTSAITSMEFSPSVGPNLVTGSRFSLYGIKAA